MEQMKMEELKKAMEQIKELQRVSNNNGAYYLTFKHEDLESVYCVYSLTESDLKRLSNKFNAEIQVYETEKNKKENFKVLLDSTTKKEYLTRTELLKVIAKYKDFSYSFDLMGWLENFKITPKGFVATDGTGKKSYFNDKANKDFKFYKSELFV